MAAILSQSTEPSLNPSLARVGAAREQLDTVQALRAIAALCVVGMHIPAIERGAFGVDLFFVISGFIVCHVAAADPGQFLLKRIIRVVPLYWLCTIALFGLALAAPQLMGATRGDLGELLKSLFFVPFGQDVRTRWRWRCCWRCSPSAAWWTSST
jgi:peptidoglycan/LPS O-acetylase OafA/YrhL